MLIVNITNENGDTITSPKLNKRLTYKDGFMFGLEANHIYKMVFDQAANPTNVSFEGTFWNIKPGQYIIMQLIMKKKLDVVDFNFKSIKNKIVSTQSITPITQASPSGSWYWENSTLTLSFILSNKNTLPFIDIPVSFTAYVCRFLNCQAPVSPALLLPITGRILSK